MYVIVDLRPNQILSPSLSFQLLSEKSLVLFITFSLSNIALHERVDG